MYSTGCGQNQPDRGAPPPHSIDTLEPLIPEAPGLLEIGKGKHTARLVRECESSDCSYSLRKKGGCGVRGSRTPIVPDDGEAIQPQGVRKVKTNFEKVSADGVHIISLNNGGKRGGLHSIRLSWRTVNYIILESFAQKVLQHKLELLPRRCPEESRL
jgi:hypothetical protein